MNSEEIKAEILLIDNAEFEVSDWEAGFIESLLNWRGELSERQKESALKIIKKYAGKY